MRTVRNTSRSNWCPKPRHFNAFVTCVEATYSYLSGGSSIKPTPSRRAITRGGAIGTGNCRCPIFQSRVVGVSLFANNGEKLRSNR